MKKYVNLYDEDFLIEVFGTTEPTVQERAVVFHAIWEDWVDHKIFLSNHSKAPEARSALRGLGLKDYKDFQVHGSEVRFKTREDLALAKLALGNTCG